MSIENIRREINRIDAELLRLFNQRAALALEIGHIKKRLDLPIYDPQREKAIFDKVKSANPGPLDDGAIVRLFERVIDESRRLERLNAKGEEEC